MSDYSFEQAKKLIASRGLMTSEDFSIAKSFGHFEEKVHSLSVIFNEQTNVYELRVEGNTDTVKLPRYILHDLVVFHGLETAKEAIRLTIEALTK